MQRNSLSLGKWLLALTLAEGLGIALVSMTYAALDRGMLGNDVAWILLAGAWEGLCLGSAQALLLRHRGISPALWISLTVLGAIAGYGLSLIGGAGAEGGAAASEPPLWLMAVLGVGAGLGMGVVLGLIQSPAIQGRFPIKLWLLANAIGWMPAMAVIMLGAGLAAQDWSLAQVAALGAASGAVAGFCVGLATGIVVRS